MSVTRQGIPRTISNNLTIDGDLTITGDIIFGDAATDILTVTGYMQGSTSGTTYLRVGSGTANHLIGPSTDDLYITGDLEIDGGLFVDTEIQVNRALTIQPSALQTLAAANSVTVNSYSFVRVQSDGGAVTLTSTPSVTNGGDNQILIIRGTHSLNTITLQDESNLAGSGLNLNGKVDVTLGQSDTVVLLYDADSTQWIELCRSNVL